MDEYTNAKAAEEMERLDKFAFEFSEIWGNYYEATHKNEFIGLFPDRFNQSLLYLHSTISEILEWENAAQVAATEEYQDYLKSERWKEIRAEVLDSEDGRCVLCNNPAEHVHHRTYERRGRELRTDLTALCSDCHAKFHDKPTKGKKAK